MTTVLSIVIPTRNRVATLRRTIEGWLRHESRASFELVVVDDGSEDATGSYLAAEASREPRLRALRQAASGPAQARNRAIAEARGRYLLLAGDDVRPGEGLVDGHVAAHEVPGAPRFVLGRTDWDPERPITPVMRHVTGLGGQQFRYDYLRDGERLGFKYFYGSNLSLRRSELEPLAEPFDPAFGGAALEDADLGLRLMGSRPEIGYRSGLKAWHDHFHDVASFCERQRRVGRATAVLFAKHPGIAAGFGAGELETARVVAKGQAPGTAMAREEVAEAEGWLAGWLGSFGQSQARWPGRICLGLFWYHQAKGMVEAEGPVSADAALLGVLMGRALACPLRSALRDPACPSSGEKRAGLGRLAERLAAASGRGRLSCLRWWLSVRGRETYHWLRSRPRHSLSSPG